MASVASQKNLRYPARGNLKKYVPLRRRGGGGRRERGGGLYHDCQNVNLVSILMSVVDSND